MAHVFIAFRRGDGGSIAALREQLREQLRGAGFEVWMDAAPDADEPWRNEVDSAIRAAFACVVILTPAADESKFVTYEWACAWGAGLPVIPVVIEPAALHPRLAALRPLDFTRSEPWDALIARVQDAAQQAGIVPATGPAAPRAGLDPVQDAAGALAGSDLRACVEAVEFLGRMTESRRALDALRAALHHAIPRVRVLAAFALAGFRDPSAVPVLVGVLRSEAPENERAAAVWALGIIGRPDALGVLLPLLERDRPPGVWHLNRAIVGALAHIGDLDVVPVLLQRLKAHIDGEERRAIIWTLGELGDPQALPALARLAKYTPRAPERVHAGPEDRERFRLEPPAQVWVEAESAWYAGCAAQSYAALAAEAIAKIEAAR